MRLDLFMKKSSGKHTKRAHKKTKLLGNMKFSHLILIFLLLLFFALVGFLIYTGLPKSGVPGSISVNRPNPEIPPGLVRAPTPYLLLPSGKQEYLVKSNPATGDALAKKITADPLDVPKGSNQAISLELSHSQSISTVTISLTTDTMTKTYPLSLASGSDKEGTWSGTWIMIDTHESIYFARFVVTDSVSHKTTIDFPIR